MIEIAEAGVSLEEWRVRRWSEEDDEVDDGEELFERSRACVSKEWLACTGRAKTHDKPSYIKGPCEIEVKYNNNYLSFLSIVVDVAPRNHLFLKKHYNKLTTETSATIQKNLTCLKKKNELENMKKLQGLPTLVYDI